MRIAYVAQVDLGSEHGVGKKIREQIVEWARHGHAVRLFSMARTAKLWEGWRDLPVQAVAHGGGLSRINASIAVCNAVGLWGPDVVYFRGGVYYPAFVKMASRMPTICEVNTDERSETILSLGYARGTYQRIARQRFFRHLKGLVAVTRELAAQMASYGIPCAVVGNGIRLEDNHTLPIPKNAHPKLVFMGTPGFPWHGIDHVIRLAEAFPDWRFELVGPAAGDVPAGAPGNVKALGVLSRDSYIPLLCQSDVALGTLALYRKSMNEASSLKVREYLARGLPTICGHRDTDFPNGAAFLLEIPNTPENIEVAKYDIRTFVERWMGHRVAHEAIAHLDISVKEERRLAFFEEVLRG